MDMRKLAFTILPRPDMRENVQPDPVGGISRVAGFLAGKIGG